MWRSSSQASEQKKCMSQDSYAVRLFRKSHPALVPKALLLYNPKGKLTDRLKHRHPPVLAELEDLLQLFVEDWGSELRGSLRFLA